jgi:Uncharacterized NAD(FAD)-dependent dehydrogenases
MERVVIVGGVAGGATAAARLRRLKEDIEIIVLEKGEYVSFANCGLPYYVGNVIKERNQLELMTPEEFFNRFNIDVRIRHEAISIDKINKNNLAEFKNKRVLILDSGDDSLELAIKLTEHTGRVIVVTSAKETPGSLELKNKLKQSDVKILQQAELLEIKGTDEVEKVIIHDFDEDENYELFVDAVILLDERQPKIS